MRRHITRRALALATIATAARAECRLEPAAIVQLRAIEGFPVIAATVHGTPVSFLLDTGAEGHLVLPEAVTTLNLVRLPITAPMIGTGGAREVPVVQLDGVQFGPVPLDPAPALVAPLPALPRVIPPVAGLIGAPLLDRFDLDLDVYAGRLGLYPAAGCGGALPAIAPRTTTITLTILPDRQALLPVWINGVEIVALLDTGSRATLLTDGAAQRLGLSGRASANTARGVDGAMVPVFHGRARELRIGDDIRLDVPVSISPVQLGRADMLLGFDVLRLRRVWISYVTGRLVLALPSPAASGR